MMMQITQNLVPTGKYGIKCPYAMTPTRIVVHNTANDASAKNEVAYMISNESQTSFHYAIDDQEIVQGVPENRNAWHAGDGGSGKGNREGIGIEICYSKSGGERFLKAEELAAKFIAELLKRYNWKIDKVTKHQDYMNKYCPHRTLDMGWARFIDQIKKYMNAEEIDMEEIEKLQQQIDALHQALGNLVPQYGYIDENMPEWARPTIQKLYNKGYLKGDETGNLQLSYNDLRIYVLHDRAGVYGE